MNDLTTDKIAAIWEICLELAIESYKQGSMGMAAVVTNDGFDIKVLIGSRDPYAGSTSELTTSPYLKRKNIEFGFMGGPYETYFSGIHYLAAKRVLNDRPGHAFFGAFHEKYHEVTTRIENKIKDGALLPGRLGSSLDSLHEPPTLSVREFRLDLGNPQQGKKGFLLTFVASTITIVFFPKSISLGVLLCQLPLLLFSS